MSGNATVAACRSEQWQLIEPVPAEVPFTATPEADVPLPGFDKQAG